MNQLLALLLALIFFHPTPHVANATTSPAAAIAADPSPRVLDCMARNIYYEARGASIAGMVAVGQVVLNRAASLRFPSDPCQVIHQRVNGRCQFSWTCTSARHRQPSDPVEWSRARAAAYIALQPDTPDLTDNALYFHAESARPVWRHLIRTARIDGHIFYKERPNGQQ